VNVLLDTHIWLWALLEPRRIRRRLASMLEDPANQLWLSPISVWKATVLAQCGRIEVSPAPDIWIRQALAKNLTSEGVLTMKLRFRAG
jgi:PIN domain nuclease of toxin-antitoxin system